MRVQKLRQLARLLQDIIGSLFNMLSCKNQSPNICINIRVILFIVDRISEKFDGEKTGVAVFVENKNAPRLQSG